ncbi:putative predicted protein [Rhizobium favelukesii]|uniref:Uncharacterized protein n=1 Tax=Rhizobium favelukesii TaxID=348824 RepID=W6R8P5_9HYPH|nr:hypothetical protein [Rhizobium favelukesii]CDM57637.1 putative predicted protein [Rhizobium favelukesii]
MTSPHEKAGNAMSEMKRVRTLERYAACSAKAIAEGSLAQVMYFIDDAKKDIATLAADRDRIERNREMWKGQVERQSETISQLREALRLLLADVKDYEAWQRPCHAVDVAGAALSKAGVTP